MTIKKGLFKLTLAVLSLIILSSCAHKRYMKDGVKYEQNGVYNLAVNSYLKSLEERSDYADARIGLMRSAMLYSVEVEEKVDVAYKQNKDDDVVKYYHLLCDLQANVKNYQLEISISERCEGQYDESKNRYLHDTYRSAQQALNAGEYSQGEKYLRSILSVDNSFKDTKDLLIVAVCEPLYLSAISH